MITAAESSEVRPRLRLPERLPNLGGEFLRAYRVIWLLAALLALLSTTVFAFRQEIYDQDRVLSIYDAGLIRTGEFADGLHVRPFSQEAHTLGVPDGVVVRINGRPPANAFDGAIAALSGRDGSRVTVSLRDNSGAVRDFVLTRSNSYLRHAYAGSGLSWSLRRWVQFGSNALANFFALGAATLLFVRRPRDSVAAILSLGILLDCISPMAIGGISLLFVGWVSGAVSVVMILLGILFFPDGRFAPRWWPVPAIAIVTAGPDEPSDQDGRSAERQNLAVSGASACGSFRPKADIGEHTFGGKPDHWRRGHRERALLRQCGSAEQPCGSDRCGDKSFGGGYYFEIYRVFRCPGGGVHTRVGDCPANLRAGVPQPELFVWKYGWRYYWRNWKRREWR